MIINVRPGGRWHRILKALQPGPMKLATLYATTQSYKHSRSVEKGKFWRAIENLEDCDLIVWIDGLANLSGSGLQSLLACEAQAAEMEKAA
jgi:hypothetical protein